MRQHATIKWTRSRQCFGTLSGRDSTVRQLIKAKDVALKLGVSVSWVIQHASGKRQPYLPAVKMGPGRSPLRFDPRDVEKFIDQCRDLAGSRVRRSKPAS